MAFAVETSLVHWSGGNTPHKRIKLIVIELSKVDRKVIFLNKAI